MIAKKINCWSFLWTPPLLFGVSLLITFLFDGFKIFASFSDYSEGIFYGFFVGLTLWIGNWSIGWLVNFIVNWNNNPQRANAISLLSFFLFGIVASVAVPYLYFGMYHQYYENLTQRVVYNGFINLAVDVIFVSIYYSRDLVKQYAKSMESEQELKRENLIAKYEALKNQVNPHFLFNSLNTLTGVVEQNPDKAVDYIKKLSDIYRYVLDQQDKELVNIKEEIKFVNDYIHLARIRHGDALSMTIQLSETEKYIAPLGLQMLVENAIKHNIISDDMPLHIEIGERDGYLYVKNNIRRKKVIKKKGTTGLENLKNRYAYLSDKPMEINDSENEFIVKIPVIEKIL